MSIICGWASIGENGRITGGRAGDQKQYKSPDYTGEVKLGSWYNFGQTAVYRWKDRTKATKYAAAIRALCNNPHVGYNQSNRTSLFTQLKNHGWDYTKVLTNCDCDCSELAGVTVNCVTKKQSVPSYVYTGNMGTLLMATGLFTKLTGTQYTGSDAYLMVGDIINNPNRHVIVALENGSKAMPKASSYKLSGVSYPSTVKKGSGFPMYGTITSANDMTRVEIGVVSKKTKKWTAQKYDKSKNFGKTFSIVKNADPVVLFGKLAAGEYYYRCWCWDVNGAKKVFDKLFVVK